MEYNQEFSNLSFVVKHQPYDQEEETRDDNSCSPSIVVDYDCKITTTYNLLPFNRRRRFLTLEPDLERSMKLRQYMELSECSLEWYDNIVCNLLELDIRPQYRDRIANTVIAAVLKAIRYRSSTVGNKTICVCVKIDGSNELVCDERRLVLQRSMDDSCIMVPASKASVHDLETKKLEFSDDSCVVCMEELTVGTEVTCMPCSHMFHRDCILSWLETGHHCPVCRFEMPTKDEDEDEDEDDDQV